tara:strand:- start:281 stop:550 length:270 start_codon:yes stop_codon:yes gene_type:complete
MNENGTRKRGRPKKESVMETLAVRLPYEIILQIDVYVNEIKNQFQGMNVTRADAIRRLINIGLEKNKPLSENITPETVDITANKKRFWD